MGRDFKYMEEALCKYRKLYKTLVDKVDDCGCTNNTLCECETKDIVRKEINFLVADILGYIEEREVIRVKCGIHKLVPVKDGCSEEMKFLLMAYSPESSPEDWDLDEAYTRAIARRSNLLIMTNGEIFKLYATGEIDGEKMQELIFEYNLLNDDLNLVSNDLWCLCRKNCGRKICIDFLS